MLIVSQNLSNYEFPIPRDAIYRINLAWVNSIEELKNLLEKHREHNLFLDLPIKRTKPPNNKYSIVDLIPVIKLHKNIKYFAISNVKSAKDLKKYLNLLPKNIVIVPKIENPEGILNINEITDSIKTREKVIMLDHDDLYSSIIKNGEPSSNFIDYINKLNDFCDRNNIVILRTIGVIFSEKEKRATYYVR